MTDEEPIGSHVLKNPDDEYEVLSLLPSVLRSSRTHSGLMM